MTIPNCMIYDVRNDSPKYYRDMITDVLGDCVQNVYVPRSGNLYDVLIVFKSIRLTNNQEEFRNALNRRVPITIQYNRQQYKVYQS